MRWHPKPAYLRERLEIDDGDFLDLDWLAGDDPTRPLVLVLTGLEGCSRSHYVRGLVQALRRQNIDSVVMHHRGCSGTPNRLPRRYHAGATEDLARVLREMGRRRPAARLGTAGYSLGGNALLKYLGESGPAVPPRLTCAAAISVPFDLSLSVARMQVGWSRLYQWRLLTQMRSAILRKDPYPPALPRPRRLRELRNLRDFDDQVTAPLHGFTGVDDYYERASCRRYLKSIHVRTLIIHALDDPLVAPQGIPRVSELGPAVQMETSPHGGHCGFVAGAYPWRPRYWLDERLARYFRAAFKENGTDK